MAPMFFNGRVRAALLGLVVMAVTACATGPEIGKPSDLGPNTALLGVRLAWTGKLGGVDFPLQVKVVGQSIVVAGSDGGVVTLDALTGSQIWQANVGSPISAGVGSDGRFVAVVNRDNELVVFDAGQNPWRARLTSQVFTAPLVAGERVFVLGADRNLAAFDAKTGRKLWQNQRPGEALVLRQSGVLMAVGNTLVAGLSGHLVGMNPLNGNVVWDAAVATPRGTNDIERLVDLVSGVSREDNQVCVRAFQAAVACVDVLRGVVKWKKTALGSVGVSGDGQQVFGVESDGRLLAWRRADGELAWSSDRLRYRQLSAPLVLGQSVVVGDETGQVHLLSRMDGAPLTRLVTDGSPITVAPVVVGKTLVVVTRNGGIFGFHPE